MARTLLVLPLFLGASLHTAQDRVEVPVEAADPTGPVVQGPQVETFAVEVELRTQDGLRATSDPVPSVTVELGVDREVREPRYVDSPVLARLESDEDGLVRTTLDLPVKWKNDRDAWIWARVETPGYVRWTVRKPIRAPNSMGLWARPGGDVFGSVRSGSGEPIEKARVWIFEEREGGFEYRRSTRSDGSGRFAIPFGAAGRFVVHARASGVGSGRSELLELDPRKPCAPIEISLGGGVSVSGRVLDPAGDPVPGVLIAALPAGSEKLTEAGECFRGEREGGLYGDFARADEDGTIAFRGLVPGDYTFFARRRYFLDRPLGTSERRLGTRLSTFEVTGGMAPFVLTLPEHRIEVRITSPEGEPIDPLTLPGGRKDESPLAVDRFVEGRAEWTLSAGTPVPFGSVHVIPVEPDQEYLVSFQHPEYTYVEERVAVPLGTLSLDRGAATRGHG